MRCPGDIGCFLVLIPEDCGSLMRDSPSQKELMGYLLNESFEARRTDERSGRIESGRCFYRAGFPAFAEHG
jgi:hypothetical protein